MSSSEIRVDTIKTRTGLGTVTISPSGLQFSGIVTSENRVDVKSYDGTPGRLDLYCESSNVHYARIQAPDHADFSGNVTLTLPNTTGTLLNSDVSGNVDIAGITTVAGDLFIADKIVHTGDIDTAIRFPANDTFAVETNGIEKIRIESSGNLGIGTNNPQRRVDIFEDDATDTVVQIRSGTANREKARIAKINRTTGNGDLQIQSSSGANGHSIVFLTDSSGEERMHIDSSGDVGIGTTTPAEKLSVAGNVRVENSADAAQYLTINYQGIDFQNTGAGSSTAASSHLLDDFEEGTWTPNLSSTSPGTGSFSASGSNGGFYTKIGKRVFFQFNLNGTWTAGTASGSAVINGLPFTNAAAADRPGNSAYSPVVVPYNDGFDLASGYVLIGGLVLPATSEFRVYAENNTAMVTIPITDAASTINIHGGGSFEVP